MSKGRKKIFIGLLIVFVILQFIRPEKNNGQAEAATDIMQVVHVPDTIKRILKTACYDCHSNKTRYPWYSEIAPASLWLAYHIKEGKAELNFSEFARYSRRRMKNKLTSIADQVENREMPLKSYLLMHGDARLSDGQIRLIRSWTDSAQEELNRKT